MKLMGFREEVYAPLPGRRGRDPRAGLQRDDPARYRALIEKLCAAATPLAEWAEPLASGSARVVLTGQQPALLGGPLYTLYKTWTAIVAARRLRREGIPAIASFYCVGDDTDYDEVAAVAWPVRGRPPVRVRETQGHAGERIGGLSAARMRPALERLAGEWPDSPEVLALLNRILDDPSVTDWSAFLRRLLLEIAGEEPLLFVDGNDPDLIEAAQPWLRKTLQIREAIAGSLERAAERSPTVEGEAVFTGTEGRRSLFRIDGASRRLLEPGESPGDDCLLLPNVVLRPAMQEYLLPVDRVVCGEGEVRYRSLLGEIHSLVGSAPAPLMRRFSATWFPPPWGREAGAAEAESAILEPDLFLNAWARTLMDPSIALQVDRLGGQVRSAIEELRTSLGIADRGLSEIAASAAGKIDFQFRRIEEAVTTRSRSRLYRSFPDLAHLREFILTRGRPQERSFSLLTPFLWEGRIDLKQFDVFVESWIERGEAGHALLALEGGVRG